MVMNAIPAAPAMKARVSQTVTPGHPLSQLPQLVEKTQPEAARGQSFNELVAALLPYVEQKSATGFGLGFKLRQLGFPMAVGILPVLGVLLLPTEVVADDTFVILLIVLILVSLLCFFVQWPHVRAIRQASRDIINSTSGAQMASEQVESIHLALSQILSLMMRAAGSLQMNQQRVESAADALRHPLIQAGKEFRGLALQLDPYIEGPEGDGLLRISMQRLYEYLQQIEETRAHLSSRLDTADLCATVQAMQGMQDRIACVLGDLERSLKEVLLVQNAEKHLQ